MPVSWQAAMKRPIPTREEELALLHRFQDHGDRAALAELIERNSRAVYAEVLAWRATRGWNLDDLMVEGMMGLQQAAEKFSFARNVRFGTYARWWVRARIRKWLCDNVSDVRVATLSSTRSEMFSRRQSADTQQRMQPMVYLDASVLGDKDGRIVGTDPGAEVLLLDAERKQRVRRAVDRVGGVDGVVLRMRLLDENEPTLEEIGKRFGFSRERARQIEKRGMERLRRIVKCG